MLIGPDSLSTAVPEPIRGLNREINVYLKNLRVDAVCEQTRLLLAGDNNWITQWNPLISTPGRSWHGREGRFNMAFLDGHVDLVGIYKGVYIHDDYRIQPFQDLDDVTLKVQSQIAGNLSGVN